MANQDRIKGKAKEATGTIQEKVGEWKDDPDMAARGEERKQEGKAQNLWGKAKDVVDDAKDAVEDKIHKS
jgi:uncharacterized protein YjbJ (UPF0337 family)